MDPECSLSALLGYNSVCARVYVSACGALGYVRGGILCCFVGGGYYIDSQYRLQRVRMCVYIRGRYL